MWRIVPALALLSPAVAAAQPPEAVAAVEQKLAALKYVYALQDPHTGGFKVDPKGKPSLRACNGAAKAIHYLGGTLPAEEKVRAFVLGCYDPAAQAFAELGGKPDVTIDAIGIMAAAEVGVPKDKFRGAMDYLKANARTFEEVRIGAAAVEAWGVKDCPFDLGPWFAIAQKHAGTLGQAPPRLGGARDAGSLAAMYLRLGKPLPQGLDAANTITAGQLPDGGWGKGDKTSDAESTYRVMRALHLLNAKPTDAAAVRGFLAKCRNPDGGYGTKPGEASSMSGVYYYAVITSWLDAMAK